MGRANKRKEAVIRYLKHGFVARHACALASVPTSTFHFWLKKDSKFAAEVEHARAVPLANAEIAIQKAIANGNLKAAMWMLERRVPEYSRLGAGTDITDEDYELEFEVVQSPQPDFDTLLQQSLSEMSDEQAL